MKVWIKTKNIKENDFGLVPHNLNIANALYGFMNFGLEIVPYESVKEIIQWVTPLDIVVDYIGPVHEVFNKFNVIPENINYPETMKEFLGRKIWYDTINHISSDSTTWGNFVKPVKEKLFTGKVINGLIDLVGCGSCYEDFDVICSQPIDVKAEWRCFICYDEIIGVKPYGFDIDYHYNYDPKVLDKMLEKFKEWDERPMGCSVDICVTGDGRTLLVEVNDGYSLGSYGLDSVLYAKLISARWSQLLQREDILRF